ncbi:unnamed protein product [Polarella glacialis]|uniref:DUF4116 domain-containing protein n=1 Tax=Polarella glacialis TaxID=89957 RepID=A0A813GE58_POLGL|nr:unnamed protein product [Polarella glacialis]CAE8625143.1 unnamed protein product [Polarella glacialis]
MPRRRQGLGLAQVSALYPLSTEEAAHVLKHAEALSVVRDCSAKPYTDLELMHLSRYRRFRGNSHCKAGICQRHDDWEASLSDSDVEIGRTVLKPSFGEKGYQWSILSEELRSNREFILTALILHYSVLAQASEELRNDRNLVLAAIYQKDCSFVHAPKQLQAYAEIAAVAVRLSSHNAKFADAEAVAFAEDYFKDTEAFLTGTDVSFSA